MGFLKTIFTLALLGVAFFVVSWYVQFASDPYKNCVDHPDKKLRNSYYFCQPLGFDLPKGMFEKSSITPWMRSKNEKRWKYGSQVHNSEKSKDEESQKKQELTPIDPNDVVQ